MSTKGQVVIPKGVRDRLRFGPGERLELIERPDAVTLRKLARKSNETFEAIAARIQARVKYAGPPVSLEEMDSAIAEMWAGGRPRWDK